MTLKTAQVLPGDGVKRDTSALGVFMITIHHAANLSAQDDNGYSDPYVLFSTRIIQQDLNPVREQTSFILFLDVEKLSTRDRSMSAVYSIFTSPHHPPVPDHLPTLIVTPHGRPSQVLYTYLHTNYNAENYLLTPSEAGDLCVAKLFPPDKSGGSRSGRSSQSHGSGGGGSHIRCEASRNLRWHISQTGIQNPIYKLTLPNPESPQEEQPLFQVSKPNPNSPWWTIFYFAYAGHLIPPKRTEFGRISKNPPEAGGGTRVAITGKSDEEKAVWKTLGEGNEDMVEWIVICAALAVLDDEIITAAEKSGGLGSKMRSGGQGGARSVPPSPHRQRTTSAPRGAAMNDQLPRSGSAPPMPHQQMHPSQQRQPVPPQQPRPIQKYALQDAPYRPPPPRKDSYSATLPPQQYPQAPPESRPYPRSPPRGPPAPTPQQAYAQGPPPPQAPPRTSSRQPASYQPGSRPPQAFPPQEQYYEQHQPYPVHQGAPYIDQTAADAHGSAAARMVQEQVQQRRLQKARH
ncbi:hypothetical protein JCM10207_003940 [Rhodosporidiobolus poonsookiae]